MATLPYNPWRVLPPSANSTSVYILKPSFASSATSQLLSLDISQTLKSAGLVYETISSALPFITDEHSQSYIPTIGDNGSILVYTGDCRKDSRGSALWKFTSDHGGSPGTGQWDQLQVDLSADTTESTSLGAGYLSSGMTFAATRNSPVGIYIFGGMCPKIDSAQPEEWTQAASYSNTMLQINPAAAASSPGSSYELSISATRGAPIPEAGFTITPLTPAYAQASNDKESRMQDQNFVLVGGHTQQAFINMSRVALFSLPEQGWTFMPIDDPIAQPNTDLAAREAATVEPRSGHTAVLSADGTRIIIFGGWVGDITSFASPQLAVLEVGNGYGGSGDWRWTVPDQTGSGPDSTLGIFGHGAAILPGNVMMITGGYQIPHSSSSSSKRTIAPIVNTKNYFYNISSNAWVDSYSMPRTVPATGHQGAAEKQQMTVSKKVGLGAGLTLAILAITALTLFAFWYTRRLQRRRDAREAELRELAEGARRDHSIGSRPQAMQQRAAGMTVVDWVGGPTGQGDTRYGRLSNGPNNAEETILSDDTVQAARTGMLFEIPSPTRGLRRSLHSRGSYQPAPRYDQSRANRGSGGIHPIDEREEDEDDEYDTPTVEVTNKPQEDIDLLATAPKLDPFRDPDEPGPSSPKAATTQKDRDGQWIKEWATAEAIARQQAILRGSPDKADRTSSTLSDQSIHSAVSAMSWPHSLGSMNRSISQRSAKVFPVGNTNQPGLSGIDVQPAQDGTNLNYGRSQPIPTSPSPRPPPTSDTYATANTSRPSAPSDNQALLSSTPPQLSPIRPSGRARGWMGSVRRALVGAERSASASPEHDDPSNTSSPTKSHHDNIEGESSLSPRRLSAGPNPYRIQRGPSDWQINASHGGGGGGGGGIGLNPSPTNHEDDWDVESAVENRVVQVMYTVPRDRLRVVNPGPDGDGISIPSRDGSVKDARGDGLK